jgi:hypothetical protein
VKTGDPDKTAASIFRITQLTPAYFAKRRREYMAQFPGALFGWPGDSKPASLRALLGALETGREEDIQQVLTSHPYLLQYAIENSGHHGTWVYPKQMIKPHSADGSAGLVPDFLVVTKSSLGYFWHVVELKRSHVQFANRKGDGYSADGNKAIAQCTGYLAHFQDYIDTVRSSIRVDELVQPKNAILLIGDSITESDAQRQCRANFVRTQDRIAVVSYRRIVAGLESDIHASGVIRKKL